MRYHSLQPCRRSPRLWKANSVDGACTPKSQGLWLPRDPAKCSSLGLHPGKRVIGQTYCRGKTSEPNNQSLLTVGACKIKNKLSMFPFQEGRTRVQLQWIKPKPKPNNVNASVSDVLVSFIIFWAPQFLGSQLHFSSSASTAHKACPHRLRLTPHHITIVHGGRSTVLASLISRGLHYTFASPGLSSETQTLTHSAKPRLLSMVPPVL